MIDATQIRKGMILNLDGTLYKVMEFILITPGRWKAIVQIKLRNLRDGSQTERRLRSEERVEQVVLEEVEMEYLYREGEDFVFMNLENYEQIKLAPDVIGDGVNYLIPNVVFNIEMHEGVPIGIEPPQTVDLLVTETSPFLKGATQSASSKPAVLETGLTVTVPQFVKEGDVIRIDTRDNKYLERTKTK
jgi:elongation factor P